MLLSYRPVVIEVPNFAALRGNEREIVILRSDNGETWREHTMDSSAETVREILSRSFDKDGSNDLYLTEPASDCTVFLIRVFAS
jgi:hypothetical protein